MFDEFADKNSIDVVSVDLVFRLVTVKAKPLAPRVHEIILLEIRRTLCASELGFQLINLILANSEK